MAAFFSNINAKIKECGTSYFLFIPMAGLIAYTFLFNISMSSPLLLASKVEKAFAVFTLLFLAFAAAALLTLALSAGLFLKSEAAAKTTKKISLLVFSGLTTLLALAVIENFTYTMFRVGIKNTDGTFAKLGYLALTGALFWFFCNIGEAYRNKIRDSKLPILNAFVGVAGIFALFNLSNNMAAWADDTTLFPQRHNVVIVSSDGIDASRMSLYGYKRKTTPFIDSVADEFLTARNAFPNNGHTTGAITSLLTGMLPTRTKVVFPPDSLSGKNALRSLPRLLRRQGYYANNIAVPHYADASEQNILEAFDKNNNRNMLSSSFPITFNYKATNWFFDRMLSNSIGIVQDVFWLHEMPNPFAQVDGAKRGFKYGFNDAKRLKSLLMDIDRTEKPFFINCHLLGTHGPFFDPEIVKFSKDTTNKDAPWVSELYDDAILTFDTYVKRVYLGLKRKGILDKTILVVMSDHGISHDPRKKVPLLIRFPGRKHAGSIDQNVQVIDIAATVIDFMGGQKPKWMEGDSLIAGAIAPDRRIFSASVEKIAFSSGVGVISTAKGRYGTMDYFYMRHCDKHYKLDVHSNKFDVSTDTDQPQLCSPAQRLRNKEAFKVMQKHLADRYAGM